MALANCPARQGQQRRESIGGNDLMLIQCYYIDSAVNVQDHVEAEDAGGDPEIDHIPDSNIDLNNYPPYRLQYRPYIGVCQLDYRAGNRG
jgi:hypothetical protein